MTMNSNLTLEERERLAYTEGRPEAAILGELGDNEARVLELEDQVAELLEALLNTLPYVEDVLANKDQLAAFKPGVVQKHAKAARAAIAKATGENT
jgi:hypothetical protein